MLRALKVLASIFLPAYCYGEVLTYGILGDAGVWNKSTSEVRNSMREGRIRQLILTGDNLYDGSYQKVWSFWRGFKIPVVAIGNHSLGYEEEVNFFGLPAEYYAYSPNPDVLFLILNSDNTQTVKKQMAWLHNKLTISRADQIFLIYHHPSYTVSPNHSWQEKKDFQLHMRWIHKRFADKITAVFVGHDHINSLVMMNKLPMVISGASWESKKTAPLNYLAENNTRIRTAWLFKGGPHWTRVDIDTKRKLTWINFVRAQPSKVVCSVMIGPGGVKMRPNCSDSQRD